MKKTAFILLSLVLVAGLLLSNTGKVQAFDWTPPVVTPVFGDSEFSATPSAISSLPGIAPNDNGLILPVGFPEGTAQFGGDAVVVKDLTQGSIAKVCFSMPPKRTEWAGSIHQWDGSKWAKLATTINYGDVESSAGTACAEIYGDGAYALIMGYTGKPEPKGLPICSESVTIKGWFMIGQGPYPDRAFVPDKTLSLIMWLVISGEYPIGTPVTYQILNVTPPGSLGGKLTQSSQVSEIIPTWGSQIIFFNQLVDIDTFPNEEWIYGDNVVWNSNITMRLIFPNCYVDLSDPFYLLRAR